MNKQNQKWKVYKNELMHILSIDGTLTMNQSVDSLLELIGTHFRCERVYIFEKNEQNHYDCTYEWTGRKGDAKKDLLQNFDWRAVKGYYAYFNRKENLYFPNIEDIKESDSTLYNELKGQGLQSVIAGQLVFESSDLGFIGIDNPDVENFDELLSWFEFVKQSISSLLYHHELLEQLHVLSETDVLTKTGSQISLYRRIFKMKPHTKLTILFFDVVNLKKINELHGIATGDETIRAVGRILMDEFEERNVFRVQGANFVFLGEGLSLDDLQDNIQNVTQACESVNIHIGCGCKEGVFDSKSFFKMIEEASLNLNEKKKKSESQLQRNKYQTNLANTFGEMISIHPLHNYFQVIYSKKNMNRPMNGTFQDKLDLIAKNYIHPDDAERFRNLWNIDILLDSCKLQPVNEIFTYHFTGEEYSKLELTIMLISRSAKDPVLLCMSKTHTEQTRLELENDTNFFREVDKYLAMQETDSYVTLACNINNYKLYKEIYGAEQGLQYLAAFQNSIEEIAQDYNGVATYFGSDNFCVVLPVKVKNGKAIIKAIEEKIEMTDFREGFQPSVGISLCSREKQGSSISYDHALIALEKLKGNVTQHVELYDEDSYQKIQREQILLLNASTALKNHEFFFYLQPKVNLYTGEIIGSEALVRWQHDGKLIPPSMFVSGMEANGYIVAVDRYIWEETCKWLSHLASIGTTPLPVSVNVSRVDMYFMDIPSFFEDLLKKYKIDPAWLEIEITESALAQNSEKMKDTIRRLRQLGFRILLDDFGSGYSSLNMLQDIEIDILKIDRGFVPQSPGGKNVHILRTIFNMAKDLNLKVITEGVETKEELDILASIGSEYIQGYYYYRPMPVNEFESLAFAQE